MQAEESHEGMAEAEKETPSELQCSTFQVQECPPPAHVSQAWHESDQARSRKDTPLTLHPSAAVVCGVWQWW